MPKLKLEKCGKRREPVELPLLNPAKLMEKGCIQITAYDNDRGNDSRDNSGIDRD